MNQDSVLLHYWAAGDTVSRLVMSVLLLMSLLSRFFILSKTWHFFHARASDAAVNDFWDGPTCTDGLALLLRTDTQHLYAPLASQAAQLMQTPVKDAALITRMLLREIDQVAEGLVAG